MSGEVKVRKGDWQRTLADAVALGPEHLSCYGLKVEEGTPLARRAAEAGA